MVLMLVAELLSGETLVTPGGPVDAETAYGDEPPLFECAAERFVEVTAAPAPEALEVAATPG